MKNIKKILKADYESNRNTEMFNVILEKMKDIDYDFFKFLFDFMIINEHKIYKYNEFQKFILLKECEKCDSNSKQL